MVIIKLLFFQVKLDFSFNIETCTVLGHITIVSTYYTYCINLKGHYASYINTKRLHHSCINLKRPHPDSKYGYFLEYVSEKKYFLKITIDDTTL